MRHENDSFGSLFDGILDGGERADDALVVCDVLVGIEGDIEVDLIGLRRQLPGRDIGEHDNLHARAHAYQQGRRR